MAGGQLFVTGYLGAGGWLFFFRAEDGIRDGRVTGVQTCALPILGILPAVLRDWQGRHPEIEVSLLEFPHRRALEEAARDGAGDIAVGTRPEDWAGQVERL